MIDPKNMTRCMLITEVTLLRKALMDATRDQHEGFDAYPVDIFEAVMAARYKEDNRD